MINPTQIILSCRVCGFLHRSQCFRVFNFLNVFGSCHDKFKVVSSSRSSSCFDSCRFSREIYVSIPPSRKVPMPLAPSTAAKTKKEKETTWNITNNKYTTENNQEVSSTSQQSFSAAERQNPPCDICMLQRERRHVDCVQNSECKGEVAICVWERCLSASDLRRDADEDEVCLPSTAATKEPGTENQNKTNRNNKVASSTTQQSFSAAEWKTPWPFHVTARATPCRMCAEQRVQERSLEDAWP